MPGTAGPAVRSSLEGDPLPVTPLAAATAAAAAAAAALFRLANVAKPSPGCAYAGNRSCDGGFLLSNGSNVPIIAPDLRSAAAAAA